MERFADVMTSVTFAEVGEYKTAKKKMYTGDGVKTNSQTRESVPLQKDVGRPASK